MFDFVKNRRIVVGVIIALLSIPVRVVRDRLLFPRRQRRRPGRHGGRHRDQRARVLARRCASARSSCASRSGGQVDAAMLDSPEVRRGGARPADRRARGVRGCARRPGITVTDAELQAMIADIPAFREGGAAASSRAALYQSALRDQGMTERMFEAMLRKDLILNRARQSVATTAFVPTSVMERLYRLRAAGARGESAGARRRSSSPARSRSRPTRSRPTTTPTRISSSSRRRCACEYAILSLEGDAAAR